MRLLSLMCLALMVCVAPIQAATPQQIDQLLEDLRVTEVVAIMRKEGMAYSTDLGSEMLPGGAAQRWIARADRIYDAARMEAGLRQSFADAVAQKDLDAALAFFASDLGQRIVALEISARTALLDPAIEAASRDTYATLRATNDARLAMIADFADANDLIETNVVGALNSNFAFFQGLAEGGALGDDMDEGEMLARVIAQEPDVRADTTDWLYSFLLLAYSPLSDAELQAYIDLSRTPAGRAMNTGLFAGFDPMFIAISRALGLSIGEIRSAQEL